MMSCGLIVGSCICASEIMDHLVWPLRTLLHNVCFLESTIKIWVKIGAYFCHKNVAEKLEFLAK